MVELQLGLEFALGRRLPSRGAGTRVLAPSRRGRVSASLAEGRRGIVGVRVGSTRVGGGR